MFVDVLICHVDLFGRGRRPLDLSHNEGLQGVNSFDHLVELNSIEQGAEHGEPTSRRIPIVVCHSGLRREARR